ncbi:hypothetical protein [Allopontixanthobacter sp.]|uniref:hypothetical protein n=1 Tax=Allopontixanthobacter sp. TaxID=2906452 RepID=UPI002ABB1D8F|nr:hypothetical protein [Allopontixanthobacter sp.]MDZ4307497.1 hypothetical protein [Allopontixanthobacter sp.]
MFSFSAQAATRSSAAIPAAIPAATAAQNTERVRSASKSGEESELDGGTGIIFAILAAAGVVPAVAVAAGGGSDSPG